MVKKAAHVTMAGIQISYELLEKRPLGKKCEFETEEMKMGYGLNRIWIL